MYFLDTKTCIYFLNGTSESVKTRLLETAPDEVAIPSVVKAELLFGAHKSRKKAENIEKVERFLAPFEISPFSGAMAAAYAEIRNDMEARGEPIGPNDLFIAAIVKSCGGILVTNNDREFSRVAGLGVENWAAQA